MLRDMQHFHVHTQLVVDKGHLPIAITTDLSAGLLLFQTSLNLFFHQAVTPDSWVKVNHYVEMAMKRAIVLPQE